MPEVGLQLPAAVVRHTTVKEEAVKACASCEPHSPVARIGSYRSLACVSVLCPRPEQEDDDDELRVRRRGGRLEARSRALKTPAWPRQANGKHTQAAI